MQTINVKLNSKQTFYPIITGYNLCDEIIRYIEEIKAHKIVVVTNSTIFNIYENYLNTIFSSINCEIKICVLDDGECYKNLSSLEKILKHAFDFKLERKDAFIAFGGGVIGDMTAFAASIYLRGIKIIQIPTTILAQVDSSMGGKTGINTSYGKNLIGTFYQPSAVISDINFLSTLPQREILSGFAEILKYSFIEKSCLTTFKDFGKFLSDNSEPLLNLEKSLIEIAINNCCNMKTNVVTLDEKENNLRAILNFGHTIGHAIEKATDYVKFTHGEAIAIGMKAIFLLAKKCMFIDNEYFDFADFLLNKYNFTLELPSDISAEQIMNNIYYDKKIKNGKIRYIVPCGYAEVKIVNNIDADMVKNVINELY